MRTASLLFVFLLLQPAARAQRANYLEQIRAAAEMGWQRNPEIISRWKATTKPSVLWGYDAPGHPVYLAAALAFLYQQTGDMTYAARAGELLSTFGDLRDTLPDGYAKTRAEYAEGVPSLSNFFYLPPYVRAYMQIRDSGALDAARRRKIEAEVAHSVDFVFRFPEWGAHNRALLRAEALQYAAMAMPSHPRAADWKQMAAVLAADSLDHWEIEDTSLYGPIWLYSLFSYAEAAGRADVFSSPVVRYYLEYFLRLIAPSGTVPDFGDASWNSASGALRFVAVFEKGAATFKSPAMKWAAQSILRSYTQGGSEVGVADACSLADAWKWADESVVAAVPSGGSREVLEDVVGKKVVFRNGWDPSSLYCLLNFRDEGDGAWAERDYLRRTLSVEEEKMHHGHADENSVVLLMNKGSVLLHDAGYRSDLPSGPSGAWRQDYFHNRLVARKNKRDKGQPLLEFLRNSGAYRPVQTKKIDFQSLRDVDMSRTRLTDASLGYEWDRTITYIRDTELFVVIDAIKVLASDYFTFANLWHAQNVVSRGEHSYDVATDSVPGFSFPKTQSLLVYFPETYAKTDGVETISRHGQAEQAVYQTISSHYNSGDTELFVTVLVPHERGTPPGSLPGAFRILRTSAPYKAFGLELTRGERKSYLCVKLDLDVEVARENIRPRYSFESGKVTYGEIETDAHFFFAVVSGGAVRYSAVNFIKAMFGSTVLAEALPNTFGLQLDGGPDRVGYARWRRWEGENRVASGR